VLEAVKSETKPPLSFWMGRLFCVVVVGFALEVFERRNYEIKV